MSFESQIQNWVSIDNQLKLLNEKTRELREKRNHLEKNITTYAKSNHLTNSTIQISDGKLKFSNVKVTAPLTFKYLEKSLNEVIKNEAQVAKIMEFIKENRDVKIVEEIKRFSTN